MKASLLRDMNVQELKEMLLIKRKQSFKIRMQRSAGIEQKTHTLRLFRREIARIMTVLKQKKVS